MDIVVVAQIEVKLQIAWLLIQVRSERHRCYAGGCVGSRNVFRRHI